MSIYSVVRLATAQALREAEFAWDDLWWRSQLTWPTLRAALVAQWIEQFTPQSRFEALVVQQAGTWLAALPMVRRRCGLMPVTLLPTNPWAPCGELLVDSVCDGSAVIDTLLDALRKERGLLWLDGVCIHSTRWRRFAERCHSCGLPCHLRPGPQVGWLAIDGDWDGYTASLSRSHRQAMTKAARRLEKAGRVQLDVRWQCDKEELPELLRSGFEVEDRSWKGIAGSSVLRTAGMFDFYLKQATHLANWQQLVLVWLRLDGQPIAFLYGYWAKNVLHAFKIGYDPQYAHCSPGQLLFYYLLERLHYDGLCQAVDFMGPLTEGIARWRPAGYTTGRVAVAAGGVLARAALWGYRRLWPALRSLRDTARNKAARQVASQVAARQPTART